MLIIEVVAITVVLLIAASIVWSTIRVGISPMPSSEKARRAIFDLIEDSANSPVYDLGSGWGSLIVPLAKKYPDRKIVGYEISLLPWLASVLIKTVLRLENLKVYRKNFLHEDLSEAEVLICYLHTEGMQDVANKLVAERRNEGVLISNNFGLADWLPEKTVQINDFYKSPIYRYQLKAVR